MARAPFGSPSSSAQAAREAFAGRMREVRLSAGLSARELSERAGWHEAKTSRIENVKQVPSESDVISWCRICSAEELTGELIAELRAAALLWLDWRKAEGNGLRQINVAVRDLYERTAVYRSYCADIIPGLLQTSDYTRAILDSIRRRRAVPVDDVDAALAERMQRQHVLYEGGHRFVFVLEQAALMYRIGGPVILAAQLRHLLEVMSIPSVSLGVIPSGVDRTARWAVESFYVHDEAQVNVELMTGFLTITNPREVRMYLQGFNELLGMAVHGRKARELIHDALSKLH